MVPRRVLRPLLVALLFLVALTPLAGRPLPVHAATVAFTVTSTSDTHDATPGDGVCADAATHCTLRAAVEEANAQPPGSAITITIPAGTYALTLGTLTLTHNTITLAGANPQTTILNGGGSRILLVGSGAFARIGGVTLTGGNAGTGTGGALANLGVTILTESAIVGNTAQNGGGLANGASGRLWVQQSLVVSDTAPTGLGGGIANQGVLTVNASVLRGNIAAMGGAIASTGTLTLTSSSVTTNTATLPCCNTGGGGGIYSSGTATIISSTIGGNVTPHGFGGGGIDNSGTLTVANSVLDDNMAPQGSGGINNGGKLTLTNSTLNGNSGWCGGGIGNSNTLIIINSSLSGNTVANCGGGILNNGTLTLTNSSLSGNTANNYGSGGGISNYGALTSTNSTLSSNMAIEGGGLFIYTGGTASVISNTFSGNTASGLDGGGIDNEGTLTLTNSTLSGNTAKNYGSGGGISNEGGTARLAYVTLAANSDGILNYLGGATMVLTSTIVANSTSGPNCSGTINESQGYNLDSGTSCGFSQPTDRSNTNPMLGPLANNGGPTLTMALLPGSPAIDHGGTSANGCPATDQRGVTRPQGPACDIGAFEYVPPTGACTGAYAVSGQVRGIPVTGQAQLQDDNGALTGALNLSAPLAVSGTMSGTVGSDGSVTATITLTGTAPATLTGTATVDCAQITLSGTVLFDFPATFTLTRQATG